MSNHVTAIFKTSADAKDAILRLESAGFTKEQVSVIATDNSVRQSFNIENDTKAAEGGAIGAMAGGLIGAIAAGLAATGAFVIPGVNVVVYGAAIAAAAGAGVGGATGGLVGALVGLGVPEYEAKRYENEIKDGAVLVAVDAKTDEGEDLVKEIFEQNDAKDIAA